ncbi:glycoside hydrolase family 43 protein [Bifidobacterium amazonense]|uniref:Glycoside hydrolase family 43 protein n=1 Tax=Bifidobacterium amazonense TaxID=2809027 RepID=A0ABS9VV17_9BIFI|nr:glycoside hydrolase family 43 protein [Bifidobacterium amazonense]MCH9275786.1 glycoside hydrolase family 43 protein [Bifidobacterium amazonense]
MAQTSKAQTFNRMAARIIANPVLRGMHPDPSWIWDETRGEIVLVNSSFELIPGLPIHTTRDLATWTHVADAVDERMARRLFLDGVADSGGLYAPTLRRIRGKYVIVCTTTRVDRDKAVAEGLGDELARCDAAGGNFAIVADSLEGPWRGPYWVAGAEGIDPDIFEDRDGTVWWTQTRPAVDPHWDGQTEVWAAPLDMDSDTGSDSGSGVWRLAGERTVLWRGYGLDAVWAEGPHLYRIGDWVYLMTAEGGTGPEHSEMMMRTFAPDGLVRAIDGFEEDCASRGVAIRPAREGERSVLGEYDRLFRACKRNPILTHRHLGFNEPVQCVGHADLLRHPTAGWLLVCLGVRETPGDEPGERFSYFGRETFVAPVVWDGEPRGGADGPADADGDAQTDPGWLTVNPGFGRLPAALAVTAGDDGSLTVADAASATDRTSSSCGPVPADIVVRDRDGVDPTVGVAAAPGYRFMPVADMDVVYAARPDRSLMLRQNTDRYVTLAVTDSQAGPIAVMHVVDEHNSSWTQVGLDSSETVGLRLRGNRLDILALPADAVTENTTPSDTSRTRLLRSYDARFLSTERAGGFVGCLIGVRCKLQGIGRQHRLCVVGINGIVGMGGTRTALI